MSVRTVGAGLLHTDASFSFVVQHILRCPLSACVYVNPRRPFTFDTGSKPSTFQARGCSDSSGLVLFPHIVRPLPPPRWRAGAFASALQLSPSSPCTTSARGTFPYQPLCVRPVHQHSPELPNRWPSASRMVMGSRARASTCPRPALPGASERMQRSYPVKAVPRQMRCSLAQQSRRSSPCVFCLSCTTPFLLHPASLRTLLPRRRGP